MEKTRAEDFDILKMYRRYVDDETFVAEDDTQKDDERTINKLQQMPIQSIRQSN